jgi:hypothetical protein
MAVNLIKTVKTVASRAEVASKKLDGDVTKLLSISLLKEVADLSNVYKGIEDTRACEPPPKPKQKPRQKKTTGTKVVRARTPRKYQPRDIKRIAKRVQQDNPCADNDMAIAAAVASCVGGLTWVDIAIMICEAVHEMIGIIKQAIDAYDTGSTIGELESVVHELEDNYAVFLKDFEAVIKFYDDISNTLGIDISLDILDIIKNFRGGAYNVTTPFVDVIRITENVIVAPRTIYECVLVHVDDTALWLLAFLRKFRVYLLAFTE